MALRSILATILLAIPMPVSGQDHETTRPHVSPREQGEPRLEITVNSDTMLLGESSFAKLSVRGQTAEGDPLTMEHIRVHANVGQVSPLEPLGEGEFRFRYYPPNEFFPQYAIVTAVARCPTGSVNKRIVIELWGSGEVVVKSKPNRNVTLKIQETVFGPVKTDRKGKAVVPIVVAPGVKTGLAGSRVIDLNLPPMNQIAAIADRGTIVADSSTEASIWIHAITDDGRPLTGATLSLVADKGAVTAPKAVGNGVYLARYSPPDEVGDGRITLIARLETNPASEDMVMFELEAKPSEASATKPQDVLKKKVDTGDHPYLIAASPLAGFLTNLGHMHSPYFTAEIDLNLRFIADGLHFLLDGGYYFSSQELAASNLTSSLHVVPISGSIAYRLRVQERVWLIGAAGAGVHLTWNSTEHADAATINRSAAVLGIRASLGAGFSIGPGQATVRIRYVYANISSIPELSGNIGGLAALIGYRFELY